MKSCNLVSKILTHSSNLSIESLSQYDAEFKRIDLFYRTWSCDLAQNRNPLSHLLQKRIRNRLVHRNKIFFFVFFRCLHNSIDQVSFVCQQKQSCRVFIQAAHRVYAVWKMQKFCNGYLVSLLFGTADNSRRLMKQEKHLWILRNDRNAINTYLISRGYPVPVPGSNAIDGDSLLLNQTVCFSSGAIACVR